EFQPQPFGQEPPQSIPDRFRLASRPGEPQEEIIRVPHVIQPSIVRVMRIVRWHSPSGSLQAFGLVNPSDQPAVMRPARGLIIDGILRPSLALRVLRDERLLDEPVQPIHVDIREDWANRPALGRPAQGRAVSPVLEVSGPEEVLYQPEEAVIGDAFAK